MCKQLGRELPPQFEQGLDFVLDEAMGLRGLPLTPDLSRQTLSAVRQLGQVDPDARSVLRGAALGSPNRFAESVSLDDPALRAATDFAADAAAREVGDVFTASGRTGSPANALAVARGVGQAVSPFTFGAIESARQRNFAGLQNERQRQLSAALQLQNLQQQGARGSLLGGQILDEQARARLMEPFERARLITSPIVSAVSGAPQTQTTTQPFTSSPIGGALGGAASGFGLGSAFGPAGGLAGAAIGGIGGLFGL